MVELRDYVGDVLGVLVGTVIGFGAVATSFVFSVIRLKSRVTALEEIQPMCKSDCAIQIASCHSIQDLQFGHMQAELIEIKGLVEKVEGNSIAMLKEHGNLNTKRYDEIIRQLLIIKGNDV